MRLIREAVQGGSRLEEGEAGIRGPASSVRNTKARRALRAYYPYLPPVDLDPVSGSPPSPSPRRS